MGPSTDRPLFTVLIPTFSRAELLPRAVASVLEQSCRDFELLIVDDASPDHTSEVVRELSDPRIRYLRHERNQGVAAARNTGLQAARGELVSLLDDDDEYLPHFLDETRAVFAAAPAEVGLSWCGVRWVRDRESGEELVREEIWRPRFASREAAYLGFLANRRVGTNCGLTFRRQVFTTIGYFDTSFRGGAEDTDLLIRLVREFDFRVIDRVCVKLHLHGGANLRTVHREKAADYDRIIGKHRDTLGRHPGLEATVHYKAGWLHYHTGSRSAGRRHLLRSLRQRPLRLKSWSALVLFELFGKRAPALHRRFSAWRSGRSTLAHEADSKGRPEAASD